MARTHQQPPPSKNTVVGEAGIRHRGYLGSSRFEPASSSSEESTSFSDVDGEVSQHLKKLGRKDPTTKLKALASLCLLFKKKSGEELAQIVPQWAFEYKRLVLDYNREVRWGTHDAMTSLVTTVGKDLVPHLTSLMGPWWFAQFDPILEVSQAAKRSLEAAFPTSERRLDALMLCITDIFLYLDENLKLAPQALSDKATPMVELEDMHQRVISSSSLLAVATLVDILGMKVQSNDSEAVTTKQKLALKAEVLLSLIEKVKGKIYQMKRKSVVHRVKHCRDVHGFKTGTTVIAATFNNGRGIIITSDTRISTEICPSTGCYSYREDYIKKINVLIEKKNFVGFSGNVEKAQNLVALIDSNVGSVSGLQGIPITVPLVVKIAQGLFLKFRHLFFGVSIIVAGVDAGCASVYSISDSGDVTQDGVLSIGSGRSLVGRAKWSQEFELGQIIAFTECDVSQAHIFDPYTGGYTHSFVTCGDDDYYIELFGGNSVETYTNGVCVYENAELKASYLGAELEVLYTSQFPEFDVSDVIV